MTSLAVRAGLLLASVLATTAVAGPQKPKKGALLRTVHGLVSDRQGGGVATAVVYLKNLRTQNVQTRITDDAASYRFSGIDPNADYEVHAEKDAMKSATRTVSSLDNRNDIVINLKLDRKRD